MSNPPLTEITLPMIGDRGQHLGLDVTWRHAVDRDALAGHLLGQAMAQPEQAGFGRGVVGLADAAGLPDHRVDIDDPAELALKHVVEDGLDHVERAREVDPQHRVPVLGRSSSASCCPR
jgi:hypothetical protein